jgi:tRNA (mo5U34)-methyltransferase
VSALEEQIAALGPWFHNLYLPDGTQTAPEHPLGDYPTYKWKVLAPHLPADLRGWQVLDVGCNAGFYSFELARRGARVKAIDSDERYLAQATWAARQYGLEDCIGFERMQVYDLARRREKYDLVLFMGVFYHLRYPLLGLDIVAQKVRRLMVFQTLMMPGEEVREDTSGLGFDDKEALAEAGWPKMAFLEHPFEGDPTNWWAPNGAAIEALLRSTGLRIVARPGQELYLCEPDPENPSCVTTWNAAELRSATGQS